jgi:hypothetical protein
MFKLLPQTRKPCRPLISLLLYPTDRRMHLVPRMASDIHSATMRVPCCRCVAVRYDKDEVLVGTSEANILRFPLAGVAGVAAAAPRDAGGGRQK